MTERTFTVTVYDGTVSPDVLDEATALYREVYVEPPYLEDRRDFAAFSEDLPRRAKERSFRLVTARLDAEPLGFALGHELPPATRWWDGALSALSADIVSEHEGRTLALIELAVRRPYRRCGIGRRLHTHFVAGQNQERATLLVRPDALAARTAYKSWGYIEVGQIRPFEGAPIYESMIRDMRQHDSVIEH